MPASIAHLLICNKAVKVLQEGGEYEAFINILDQDERKPYLNLGSIGPDLSYYGSPWEGLKNLLLEQSDKPLGVDGWSYLLHSRDPNQFPLTLIELTWKDTRWEEQEWEGNDFDKFAFVCGFLSHMAADQIIHRLVNDIAGPYYRKGENRKIHRECEIYQDVGLFHSLYPKEDFVKKSFHLWVDLDPQSSLNAPKWFRYFIQRGFVESHGVYPKEEEIEDWVDGLLLILRGIKWIGPYKTAYEELKEQEFSSEKFIRYFKDYMNFFFQAVELTSIYWRAVFELYDPPGHVLQISDPMRKRFKRVVQNSDLSSPLQKNILKDAKEALQTDVPRKFNALLSKRKLAIRREKILSIHSEDVGKFS
ncbi:MAG: zinc dependent phospholipase C family protein [Syntrophaceae bacterium]|nr:zinc dependent phospholipase C family protein [Syntrophaceae bacterium]